MLDVEKKRSVYSSMSEALSSGSELCLTIKGKSMSPILRPNDTVAIKQYSPDELCFGDIITYRRNDDIFTHRFLYKKTMGNDRLFFTKGDSALVIDHATHSNEILGKVISLKRGVRQYDCTTPLYRYCNVIIGVYSFSIGVVYELLRRLKAIIIKP